MKNTFIIALTSFALLMGCSKKETEPATEPASAQPSANLTFDTSYMETAKTGTVTKAASVHTFSLAVSEYPSWSVFLVAHETGLIDGDAGELGPIEKKWNVDIDLKEADYDSCLGMYGSGATDGVAITNMDVLNPALTRSSVAILPTSTSNGADALIVTEGITDVKQLKGKKIRGLAKSVSEYTFVRNLELLGEKESEYKFVNMDPQAAATAMQTDQTGYDAIVVWNPFVLDTLEKREGTRVLFDSTSIPGEILDMIVVSRSTLSKEGGVQFANAVVDTFYAVNGLMEDPATSDDTLVALGEKFSSLDLESMKVVVKQTQFYSTPDEGIAVFTSNTLGSVMDTVIDFCVSHDIVDQKPTIAVTK